MARSTDYLRLATSATRTLAEAALDSIREAVIVVDTRLKHLPLVLANGAARSCLSGDSDSATLADSSLYGLLAATSAAVIESLFVSLAEGRPALTQRLTWRFVQAEAAVQTDIKLLESTQTNNLVMLSFALLSAGLELSHAVKQLQFDLLILDTELNVAYANDRALRSSGVAGEIVGRSALTLKPTKLLPPEVYRRALEGCHYHHDAAELAEPGASLRYFEIDVQPISALGGITGLVVLSTDVSERGLPRGPQGSSARHLRSLVENSREIACVAGSDGKLIYCSNGAGGLFGYGSGQERSNSIFDCVHPDDAADLRAKYGQLTAGLIAGFSQQHRVRSQDGAFRWLESSYVSALDNPLIKGVTITSRDITERKRTETQLAQREEVFRLATDAVDGVIFEWDLTRGIVHRSRGVLEILGIEPEDMAPVMDAWRERIHPRDVDAAGRQVGLALIEGRGWTSSYRIRDVRGRYRSMLERGLIQRNVNGDPVRAIGCCVDVSEIKRLTDLLGEAQRTAKMGAWEYSYSTLELTWTDEMFHIYDTSPAEFVVCWESVLAQCTLDSRQRFHDAWKTAESADGKLDLELEISTLKNQRIWIRMIGQVERLEGRSVRAFGSVQNIQAQKIAQIELENSTDWLKLSINMAHMHAWRWDKSTDRFDFAIVDWRTTHLPTTLPTLKEAMARVHPKDRMTVSHSLEDSFRKRVDVQIAFRLKLNGTGYRSYSTIVRPVFDAAGNPQGLVGVSQDVTERHESETKLRRSEQLLRTTTANTADTLILVDTELRIRFINRGIGSMSIDQIVGCEISALLPESSCGVVVAKLRHVLNTGEPATYEFEASDNGAEPHYFENRAVLVQDEGTSTGISISVADITERKRLEREILDVSSRERHTIGRDLHDGLGQELTGVALMLRSLATRFQHKFPEGVAHINEVVGLVNQSIESARSLARGLLPVRTDAGGLPFALRELAGRGRDLYALEVNFRAEIWPEITLSEVDASHLYRIAQEALTNAARHGDASKVEILLMVTKNTFLLRITDDGVGIGNPNRPVTGMGLKIMKYRAGMIGAKIEVGANVARGTIVRVTGEQPTRSGRLQYGHAIYGGSEYGR